MIGGYLRAADNIIAEAHACEAGVDALRGLARAFFDHLATEPKSKVHDPYVGLFARAEDAWAAALASSANLDRVWARAAHPLETAFVLDAGRSDVRRRRARPPICPARRARRTSRHLRRR